MKRLDWDELEELDGEELSRTYCVTCHAYPDSKLLPKESWSYLLDLMGLYFGYDDGRLLSSLSDGELRADLFDIDKYPNEPTLGPFQWAAIRDFYESSEGSGVVDPPGQGSALEGFEVSLIYGDDESPITSVVRIGKNGGVFLGDAKSYNLVEYDSSGVEIRRTRFPGAIVQLDSNETTERVTVIGRMHPSNSATGSIFERRQGEAEWVKLIGDLHRPVHALAIDLDGDALEEIVVNEFGHYRGGLKLVERQGGKAPLERVLRSEPGSISAKKIRLGDGDDGGHFLALNAQARQDITLYRHVGDLQFESSTLIEKNPSFGYTQLHLVDLTGDGKEEVVTINGDNADLPGPPLKRYHGVRIYQVNPGPELKEIAYLHVPGAFQATFGDFDGNGLNDIAVVSFFPDARAPDQGFALFENRGSLEFSRRIHSIGSLAPWMTIDSGDIDGDGDRDIVLGSGFVDTSKQRSDSSRSLAGLILRNRTAP